MPEAAGINIRVVHNHRKRIGRVYRCRARGAIEVAGTSATPTSRNPLLEFLLAVENAVRETHKPRSQQGIAQHVGSGSHRTAVRLVAYGPVIA